MCVVACVCRSADEVDSAWSGFELPQFPATAWQAERAKEARPERQQPGRCGRHLCTGAAPGGGVYLSFGTLAVAVSGGRMRTQ
jgi:hypothetical protein